MNGQEWHARLDGEGMPGGTGFLVDGRHIVTCEHVVRNVRGPVQVTFTAFPDLPSVAADVVASDDRPSRQAANDRGDLAVLRTKKNLSIRPAKLAPLTVLRWKSEELRAFGYPRHFDTGTFARNLHVNTDHLVGNEAYELTATDDVTSWLREGFSGAAVYLPSTGDVVGMVLQASQHHRNALMMPADVMCRYWPELLRKVRFDPLSPMAYPDLRRILLTYANHLGAAELFREMKGYSDWGPELPPQVRTALQLAEFVGTESLAEPQKTRTRLYTLMRVIVDAVDPPGKQALGQWTDRHLGFHDVVRVRPSPAAIVVKVEPTAEDPNTYRIGAWRVLGEGHEGEPVDRKRIATRDRVQREAEKLVMAGISGLPATVDFILEFVLPRRWLLSREVDNWGAPPGFDEPLGESYPVVARDLDRFEDLWHQREMKQRWNALRDGAVTPVWIRCRDDARLHQRGFFKKYPAVFLASPPADLAVLDRMLGASVPILAWTRSVCVDHSDDPGTDCAGSRFTALLRQTFTPFAADEVPLKVLELRRPPDQPDAAEPGAENAGGHAITLIWDDPARSPQEGPLGLA